MTEHGSASATSLGPRILVIDDDPGLASTLAWGLSDRGSVQSAESVEDSKRFAGRSFDLIVLDLRLPDGDGLDAIEWFRATPFVVVTGFATTASTVRAMKLGAVSVLEKPVDIDALLPMVEMHRAGPVSARGGAWSARRPAVDSAAHFIVQACSSDADLRTLADWARHVGVSRTGLKEQLRLAGVRAQHAKDFADTFSRRTGLSLLPEVRRSVYLNPDPLDATALLATCPQ